MAAMFGYAGQAAAVSFTVGSYALGIYGMGGSLSSLVRGYNVACIWDMPGEMGIGFVRENGSVNTGAGTAVLDSYGMMLQRNLGSQAKIGIGVNQMTISVGGVVVAQGFTYDLQGRIPIKKFATASLGVMAGVSYVNLPVTGAVLIAPRIALVGMR